MVKAIDSVGAVLFIVFLSQITCWFYSRSSKFFFQLTSSYLNLINVWFLWLKVYLHEQALLGSEHLSIVFSPELFYRSLTYWNELYHIAKSILSECFSLWPMYFQIWHLDGFFISYLDFPPFPNIWQRLTKLLPYFIWQKAQTHLKLHDLDSSGGNCRFDNEFLVTC